MKKPLTFFKRCLHLLLAITFLLSVSLAAAQQEINLLPKYGLLPKTDAQQTADKVFVSGMDETYHGDRKKAASDAAMRGWQYLKQGNPDNAMRRFNQAWLLDKKNGTALWGMAAVEGSRGKFDDSLKLFAEAKEYIGEDINFSVDYARTVGAVAIARKDDALLRDAFDRYQHNYEKAPQNVLNLQNWAIALYCKERYAEAWAKVKLAEATPNRNQLDSHFLADLGTHMPRPKD